MPDEPTREELPKENASLRAVMIYLKEIDALLQAKKQTVQKKRRK
ncbi:hypothetical protein [Burkholderia sp. HI2714]